MPTKFSQKVRRAAGRASSGMKFVANKVGTGISKIPGIINKAQNLVSKAQNSATQAMDTAQTWQRKGANTGKKIGAFLTRADAALNKNIPIAIRKGQNSIKTANNMIQQGYQTADKVTNAVNGYVDKFKNAKVPKLKFKPVTKVPLEDQAKAGHQPDNPVIDLNKAIPQSSAPYTMVNSDPGEFAPTS